MIKSLCVWFETYFCRVFALSLLRLFHILSPILCFPVSVSVAWFYSFFFCDEFLCVFCYVILLPTLSVSDSFGPNLWFINLYFDPLSLFLFFFCMFYADIIECCCWLNVCYHLSEPSEEVHPLLSTERVARICGGWFSSSFRYSFGFHVLRMECWFGIFWWLMIGDEERNGTKLICALFEDVNVFTDGDCTGVWFTVYLTMWKAVERILSISNFMFVVDGELKATLWPTDWTFQSRDESCSEKTRLWIGIDVHLNKPPNTYFGWNRPLLPYYQIICECISKVLCLHLMSITPFAIFTMEYVDP